MISKITNPKTEYHLHYRGNILYAIVLTRVDTLTVSINTKSQSNLITAQCRI